MIEYNIEPIGKDKLLVMFRDTETSGAKKGDCGSDLDMICTVLDQDSDEEKIWFIASLYCSTPSVPECNALLARATVILSDMHIETMDDIYKMCNRVSDKRNEFIFSYTHSKTKKRRRRRRKKTIDETLNQNRVFAEIENLKSAYSPHLHPLIDDYWNVIRQTRKSNTLSENIILKTMKKWADFDETVVHYALKKHIEDLGTEYNEKYTLGIMRHTNIEEAADSLNRRFKEKPKRTSSNLQVINTKSIFGEGNPLG